MKKNLLKIMALTIVCVLAVTALAACGAKKADDNKLVMATNAAFPPYEYYENEKIVGIDAEIAAAIAEKLGMELEIQDTEFGSIITGVQSGKYDMGMAGMTVTDERKLSVNFSDTQDVEKVILYVWEMDDTKLIPIYNVPIIID